MTVLGDHKCQRSHVGEGLGDRALDGGRDRRIPVGGRPRGGAGAGHRSVQHEDAREPVPAEGVVAAGQVLARTAA
jgi:hypothetical protein